MHKVTIAQKEKAKRFHQIVFAWFRAHERQMAWRETFDPYEILVSEVMLQQTQVDRVRTKYDEFLARFPDVHALAVAPLSEVLTLWSGLGYNRRARYLQDCAKVVVAKYGGVFPQTYEELVALPGIGRSTAGALLAFSFGEETPMIDTNIRRILTRVFFARAKTPPSDKELYNFACAIIPRGKGRVWNYALLDIGATLCTARGHHDDCPLVPLHGKVADVMKPRKAETFHGSARFWRGKIMRALIAHGDMSLAALAKEIDLPKEEAAVHVDALSRDGLIHRLRGRVMLGKG